MSTRLPPHTEQVLTDVGLSPVVATVVKTRYPWLPPHAQEDIESEIRTRCCEAVIKGIRPTPGIPLAPWLRGLATKLCDNRDIRAMAARLLTFHTLTDTHATPLWSTASSVGQADDDDVDTSLTLYRSMPPRWTRSVHGRALTIATGLGFPQPAPIWNLTTRARLRRTLSTNHYFAHRDLAAYVSGTRSETALAPIWASLGDDGRRCLLLGGIRPSQRAAPIQLIALDTVTDWPRPSRKRLDLFVTDLPNLTDVDVVHATTARAAASAWIQAVFSPVATHATRLRSYPPAPRAAAITAALRAAAHLPGHPLGSSAPAVARRIAAIACTPPYDLHLAALTRS